MSLEALDGMLSRSCIFLLLSSHADNNARAANVPLPLILVDVTSWWYCLMKSSCARSKLQEKIWDRKSGYQTKVREACYIRDESSIEFGMRSHWGGMAWEWGATNEWVGVCVCILKRALYQLKLCNTRHFVSTEERFRFPRAASWPVSVLLWFRLRFEARSHIHHSSMEFRVNISSVKCQHQPLNCLLRVWYLASQGFHCHCRTAVPMPALTNRSHYRFWTDW